MIKLFTPSVFALFLLLPIRLCAQEILNLRHSCSFDGDQEDTEIYANEPSDEATKIIRKIMALNVLPQNFTIKSGNCKNALASTEGKQRYILYSTTFLESFRGNDNAQWATFCVMAHEIGHHLANHDMEDIDPKKRKMMEIQADKFAGGILFRLGSTLPQAQAGILLYTDDAVSKTHPPKSARLEAVASGWKQAQEQQRVSVEDRPVKDEPTQPIQKTPPSVSKLPFEPDMVFVQGGTFKMGSNDWGSDSKPVHSATLSSFSIGKYEITVEQFKAFIDEMAYQTDADKEGWSDVHDGMNWQRKNGVNWRYDGDGNIRPHSEYNHPVIHVSWNDAVAYSQWLSRRTGKNYRLPTEAEWEFAARGGNSSNNYIYSGSNTIENVAWYGSNSGKNTHLVGTKQANDLGIYDMSGNVREWCSDWYDEDYYKTSPSQNPKGASSGSFRALRGGDWLIFDRICLVTCRSEYKPVSRNTSIGFRVGRTD